MNDGPLCRCSRKAQRSGIRHDIYPGEEVHTRNFKTYKCMLLIKSESPYIGIIILEAYFLQCLTVIVTFTGMLRSPQCIVALTRKSDCHFVVQ